MINNTRHRIFRWKYFQNSLFFFSIIIIVVRSLFLQNSEQIINIKIYLSLWKISLECIKYTAISMYGASIHLISRHSYRFLSFFCAFPVSTVFFHFWEWMNEWMWDFKFSLPISLLAFTCVFICPTVIFFSFFVFFRQTQAHLIFQSIIYRYK